MIRVIRDKISKSRTPVLSEIIERVRRNPPTAPPTEAEIEEIVHQVRRKRR